MMRKVARQLPVLALVFCILSGLLLLPVLPERAEAQANEGASVYNDLALKAVQFNYRAYRSGTQLDAYDAYVLTLAEANISRWVYENRSLKDAVLEEVYATLKNPGPVPAKKVAYQLLVTGLWGCDDLAGQLADILRQRQKADGSFDGNIYSDIPAYEALARAGKIGVVSAVYAREYLLKTQCTVAGETYYGAWAGPWGPDFMSTAQAIRALTYLPGAACDAQIQKAITDGLAWMQKQQQVDGSVYVTTPWPDDPLIDTAETIFTLKALGNDPATWKSSQGKTPVDWMVEKALNDDGSFGAFKNVMDATWALHTYLLLGGTIPPSAPVGLNVTPVTATVSVGDTLQYQAMVQHFNGLNSDVTGEALWAAADDTVASVYRGLAKGLRAGQTVISAVYGGLTGSATLVVTAAGGGQEGELAQALVGVAVVGKNGELLFPPGSVLVKKSNRWGITALGALDATGLPYETSTQWPGFVTCIAGQCNEGMYGWMYKVNGQVPSVLASEKAVRDGDRVIWWYSKDPSSTGPVWDELLAGTKPAVPEENPATALPDLLKPSREAEEALARLGELLGLAADVTDFRLGGEVSCTVVVTGEGQRLPWAERLALKKKLAANNVELKQEITADRGGTLADTGGEVAVQIPAGALKRDTEITVKEVVPTGAVPPVPSGYRLVTPFYACGPDGTTFTDPVTLIVRLVPSPVIKPENLVLGCYDARDGEWKAVPAVVDTARGLIVARVRHFSTFAVLGKEVRRPFDDTSAADWAWAREAVEVLAGAGIVQGVDATCFAPGRQVTRAEFVSLLVRALDLPVNENGPPAFKDVSRDAWYAGTTAAAVRAGLVTGYEDGTFRPDRPLAREELATILVRALDVVSDADTVLTFADAAGISGWARTNVAKAVGAGLLRGYPDGTFRPAGLATRAEAAVLLYRALAQQ